MTLLKQFIAQESAITATKSWSEVHSMAITLAVLAHAGQYDYGRRPYITHPMRIMAQFSGVQEQVVGILHDVVEDTEVTARDLRNMGFPQFIVDSVEALTHAPDEDYEKAIDRVLTNDIATRVKIADIEDNTALWRSGSFDEKEIRRIVKYKKAWKRLTDKEQSAWKR